MTEGDIGVVVAAAGAGRRFGSPKHFLRLAGSPLLFYSFDAFSSVKDVSKIVLVLSSDDLEEGRSLVRQWKEERGAAGCGVDVAVVRGGERRQDSVRNGLEALPAQARYVLVHDAARPLILPANIREVITATREHGAAVLGTPCHDSVKRVEGAAIVEEIPRSEVWTVQTPQSGPVAALREAYDQGAGVNFTDEASALRARGVSVALVEGSRDNIKITRRGDEAMAELILMARKTGG